jgi:Uma2 family endonuclease
MGPGERGHPGRFRRRRGRSKKLFSRYRDRDVKLPIYASAGIPEAWLLDVSAERLEVHRHPTPDGYQDMRRL